MTHELTDPPHSRASPLPQLISVHHSEVCRLYSVKGGSWLAREGGLPVIHELTDPPHSRASPLPQVDRVQMPPPLLLLFCGSWLACDADTSVYQAQPVDAIAGKPAPTEKQSSTVLTVELGQLVGVGLLANAVGQSAHLSLTHRLREQARSHKLTAFSRHWEYQM